MEKRLQRPDGYERKTAGKADPLGYRYTHPKGGVGTRARADGNGFQGRKTQAGTVHDLPDQQGKLFTVLVRFLRFSQADNLTIPGQGHRTDIRSGFNV